MKLKCIIIDDDQFAIDTLIAYVEKIPELNVHATYTNAIQALTTIRSEDAIDFVFLDIEMPELSGLTLAKSIRDKAKVLIFTTGHPEHALNAFNLNATQYLLKPITFEKFATVISYIMGNLLASKKMVHAPTKLQFIKADNKNAFHYIDAAEIIYIEAAKNYVVI
ncbi:MAG: response regulator transcription factor, partial [Flavobacteriales bacterium]